MYGMASQHYVGDAPGGGGKIPLSPNYVVGMEDGSLVLRNYAGNVYRYPETELDLNVITPESCHNAD